MLNSDERSYQNKILNESLKVINTLKLPVDDNPIHWNKFKKQTKFLDELRNESFDVTFPELSKIYKITEVEKSL